MATRQGKVAKLAWREEPTAGWGTLDETDFSSTTAYRIFFDNLQPTYNHTPIDFEEISGLSVYQENFEEGGIEVGLDVTFRVRYSGIHAVFLGTLLGSLTTTAPSKQQHRATCLATGDLQSMAFVAELPRSNAADISQHLFTGQMLNTLTLRHSAGDIMQCTASFIGKGYKYLSASEEVTMPTASPRVPHEAFVNWHHKETDSGTGTGIEVYVDGRGQVDLALSDWEVRVDNKLARRYLIQTGREGAEPVSTGEREVAGRLTVDPDLGWDEFAYWAQGREATSDQTAFQLAFRYTDPGGTDEFNTLVNGCKVLSAPPAVPGPGILTMPVDFRAHYASGPVYPMQVDILNDENGPNTATDWGDLSTTV